MGNPGIQGRPYFGREPDRGEPGRFIAERGTPNAAPQSGRVEPGLGVFLGEPAARGDVDVRIGRPIDPGLVAAELGQAL